MTPDVGHTARQIGIQQIFDLDDAATSSALPLWAGNREWLLRKIAARISSASCVRSIMSTSIRAVMMVRTARSPSRITPLIMARSPGSITPAVSASAISTRISSSLTLFSSSAR
jgi:hypothetical protein